MILLCLNETNKKPSELKELKPNKNIFCEKNMCIKTVLLPAALAFAAENFVESRP